MTARSIRSLWRHVLAMAALMMMAAQAAAELRATLDQDSIVESETVQLTVRVLGDGGARGEPDFSALTDDFDVLTTRTSSEFSSVRGRISSWTAWILTLQPKRTGTLEIPSFSLGPHSTEPLQLTVSALDADTRRFIDSLIFFETKLSTDTVYVQAQLLLERSLYYAEGVQLFGELPREPEIPNAMVQPLGDAEISRTSRDGQRYRVISQRFAIFPERSGELVIPSASVSGSAIMPRAEGFSGRRAAVDARSGDTRIDVLPIPADWPSGTSWFPATDVELLETWDREPDHLNAGEPAARGLLVRAESALASMVPPLEVDYPDTLRLYPKAPDLHESASDRGVIGTRVEAGDVVGHAAGHATLPGVSVLWFDTAAEEIREASVPPRNVEVRGAGQRPAVAGGDAQGTRLDQRAPGQQRTPWLAWVIGLLLLAAAAALWRFRRSLAHGAACLLSSRHAGHDDVMARPVRLLEPLLRLRHDRSTERRAHQLLERTLQQGDPARIRPALGHWLQCHYQCREAAAWQMFNSDPAGKALHEELNATLYAPGDRTFDTAALRAHIKALRKRRSPRTRRSGLPALYPETAPR